MKNNFKELRESLKLSQSQFANKFNMPVKTVQSWESGIRNPPKYVLIMMLRICELEAELEMIKREEDFQALDDEGAFNE